MLQVAPEVVVWHCTGAGSRLAASAAASLRAARLVGARSPRGTSQRAGGVSSINSSEARSCRITLKGIKVIIGSCPE